MTSQADINAAYRQCQKLAQKHYENFPVASLLLPKRLRQPICVIYAFARTADDIADEGTANSQQRLAELADYRQQLELIEQGRYSGQSFIFIALNDVIQKHKLPLTPFNHLLSAFKQDVSQHRYRTERELLDYCRRSANPIGRLLLYLNGNATQQQLKQADSICTALQLINFYQDIKQDWQENNRLYLPLDDLQQFELTEHNLIEGNTTDFAPMIRQKYHYIATLLIDNIALGESLSGRLGWEIRTIILMGIFSLKALSTQNDANLLSRPRLSRRLRIIAIATALIKPIYRICCRHNAERILKANLF